MAPGLLFALAALTVPFLALMADDQLVKNDGTIVSGTILGVDGAQVMIENHTASGGIAKFPVSLADIKTVNMTTPAEATKVQAAGTPPGDVIAALDPLIKKFAGLPAGWVVAAMAQLGDTYEQVGQLDKAGVAYDEITRLYPGSAFEKLAQAGKADLSFSQGKTDEALAALQPIIDQANKDIAPSPSDGALYAKAFLVYGKVLEAQKKPQQALEAYLTVKTMFYQNPALAGQADELAKSLKDKNAGLGVE